MDMKRNEEPSKRFTLASLSLRSRHTLCVLILLFSLPALYILTIRLMAETHIHRAGNLFREGYYGLALARLQKADRLLPNEYRIRKELGNTYDKLAGLPGEKQPFPLMQTAREHYREAFRLNPLDAESAYALARIEEKLEYLDRRLHPGKNGTGYDPLAYFREAIRLRPNGITYHYALARYLHRAGAREELMSAVRTLARIYPSSSHYLTKEPFWSPPVMDACKAGLREAIDGNISPREAHRSMSRILAAEGDWHGAISHYREAMRHDTLNNSAGDYPCPEGEDFLHLGRLYLKGGQNAEAENTFLAGLGISKARERDLERLYGMYRQEGRMSELNRLYEKARARYAGSSGMDILLARTLIDLKQYNHARRLLSETNLKQPSAEAWYWLARIAEAEQDWNAMELAIQKATVLDPGNSRYHLIFSQVLKRRNKLERAEREASLAVGYQENPSPWFYNHRAGIRWSRGDYAGALNDWKSAIALKSDAASFYAQAAEACIKMGDLTRAKEYYRKAVALEPANERYGKRYHELN